LGELIKEAAARHGAIYFDLAAEMKNVPPERFPELFLSGDELPYPARRVTTPRRATDWSPGR
jgi:hypothetical protein